ncbi:acyltransferase [Colletotrichum eremochloae]|nr:acyltransferase [Colletotrichum eremochloae]
MCKESLEAVNDRFWGPRSGGSYVALDGGEGDRSAELPLNENGATPSSLRAGGYGTSWHTRNVVRRVLMFLLPSFLARALGHVDEDAAIPAVTTTSYLNGLRGLAATFVAIYHNTDDFLWVHRGWGQTPEDYYLVQLPFIRLVYAGGSYMVSIFFVISGFALTYSPLKKCHAGQGADAIAALPSSIFRRPFRLFMPVVPALLASTVATQNQWYYQAPMRSPMGPVVSGIRSYFPFIWGTLVTIITNSTTGTILPPGWTLSIEYQGSLLVFMCCLAFARTSAPVRIFCVFALLAFFLHHAQWQSCLFLAGMILGDIRHVRQKLPPLEGRAHKVASTASWLLLVVSLFFGGWPTHGDGYAAAWYSWFAWVPTSGVEPMRFFVGVGAIGLVAALENLPVLQRGLCSRAILYLGEISYSLYLLHWLIARSSPVWGLRYRMLDAGYSMGFAWTATFVIMMVFCIWLGDIHWRLFDQKSVRFSHWLTKTLGI